MQTSLDRWWPVTYDFGLIKADIDLVADARVEMYAMHSQEITTRWLSEPLEACFSHLTPLGPAPHKELFLETAFGWTAYFANGCRGSDPSLPMMHLSKALGVTALRACRTPASKLYQAVILEVYDTPEMGGNEYGSRRSIAAANDGGQWSFHQSGTPYGFEDVSKFDARVKCDRFTPEMLSFYLKNLGVPELSDQSLQPDGTSKVFLLARPDPGHLPRYSLEDAKSL